MKEQEHDRVAVLEQIRQGAMTAAAAAEVLGRSLRQVRRLIAADRHGGAAAMRHGHHGRPPAQTLSPTVRQQVRTLAQTT